MTLTGVCRRIFFSLPSSDLLQQEAPSTHSVQFETLFRKQLNEVSQRRKPLTPCRSRRHQQLVSIQVLTNIATTYGSNVTPVQSYLSELGHNVSNNLKQKIANGEYVNLCLLVDRCSDVNTVAQLFQNICILLD